MVYIGFPILEGLTKNTDQDGTSWDKLLQVSFLLHRSQKLADLKAFLERDGLPGNSLGEYYFVDGYAGERSLLEVEITARID